MCDCETPDYGETAMPTAVNYARTCQKAKELSVKADSYGNLKASPNALFEDMRKYFHSGSEKYRQVAIDWADDPRNGCKLVKRGVEVVDIAQVDF